MANPFSENIFSRQRLMLRRMGPPIDKKAIYLPPDILESWQDIVNTVAGLCKAAVALMTRRRDARCEILCTSDTADNPFTAGGKALFNPSFCDAVFEKNGSLRIDGTQRAGMKAPAEHIRYGFNSYLGLPLCWPDGERFGALCIALSQSEALDDEKTHLMQKFKELADVQLAMLYRNEADRTSLEYILNSIKDGIIAHDLDRHILFFNDMAEKITGYRREDVLGKDCHQAFGEPFCGNRCGFTGETPAFKDKSEYRLNITTKNGRRRVVDMTAVMIKDENDNDIGVLATFRDLTELIQLRLDTEKLFRFANIIGRDSRMISVFKQIRDVTDYDFPVHISGETGTGKELVAHAIHNESRRSGAPFVPINCGALPEGLIESELFGHVKGAFSGAIRDKKGRFELAHGGTVFLDEVSELPKLMQVKLLRFLQEGRFEKVGGEKTHAVDVRIISATNKDLKRLVRQDAFREDLFYRLNVIPIQVPPLRERKNDIPLLVDHFLRRYPGEHRREPIRISDEALSIMMDYRWPGNVRELQNAVQFAIVRCKGETISPQDLPMELRPTYTGTPLKGPPQKLTPETVQEVLSRTAGNKLRAAKLLGVGRATLYRFLSRHPELPEK